MLWWKMLMNCNYEESFLFLFFLLQKYMRYSVNDNEELYDPQFVFQLAALIINNKTQIKKHKITFPPE